MRLTRRHLLQAAPGAALWPLGARALGPQKRPEHLIVVIADGGWDVTFAFDPKVGVEGVEGPEVDLDATVPSDAEEVRAYGDSHIIVNDYKRPAVTSFFESWGDRACVLNGLWMGSIVHQVCRLRLLTGSSSLVAPDVATIIGHHLGGARPLGTIDLGGLGFTGPLAASAGRIGVTSQIKTLVDPSVVFRAPEGQSPYPLWTPDPDIQATLRAHLESRTEKFRTLRGHGALNDLLADDLLASLDRKARLEAEGPSLFASLDAGAAPDMALQGQLAVELLRAGLCQTVTLQHFDNWDTHGANALQHERYESLFSTVNGIMEDLAKDDLIDRTMVAVVSEMTRTPRRNATTGKDHWQHTSALLVGAGVVGGRTIGATDDLLESLPMDLASGDVATSGDPCRYDHLAAGLLAAFDVDPEAYLPGVPALKGAFA